MSGSCAYKCERMAHVNHRVYEDGGSHVETYSFRVFGCGSSPTDAEADCVKRAGIEAREQFANIVGEITFSELDGK